MTCNSKFWRNFIRSNDVWREFDNDKILCAFYILLLLTNSIKLQLFSQKN